MQDAREKEEITLNKLKRLEDLAQKKINIFSHILMDVALAQDMEALSLRHQQRKNTLCSLLGQQVEEQPKEQEQEE